MEFKSCHINYQLGKNHSAEQYNSIQSLYNCGGFVQINLAQMGLHSQNYVSYVILSLCWPQEKFA